MSSFSFKFVIVALVFASLASAGVPNKRSTQWLQENGPAAKALNDQYATLNADSSCNDDGAIACIDSQFAVCVQGRYLTHSCASGWSCAAIPNEWESGTSTTCDTNEDIAWRFSQAGISETKRSLSLVERTSWLVQNGPAAKALNDEYATLTTSSSCSSGVACVDGKFATCVEGRYLTWSCASGWTCAAIPDDSEEGTTTTCDTIEDIQWRFSQAGISES